jgi:glycosyltransferase involved in cell wall biosynthesis
MSQTPKEKKPSILFVPWENSGVGLYRLIIPMISLGESKLAKVETIDEFTDDILQTVKVDFQALANKLNYRTSNIIYTTKPLIPQHIALCQMLQGYGYKWVLDMDDNIFEVNKDNPGFRAFDKEGQGDARFWIEVAMRSCDLLMVSNENLKDVYRRYNPNIFINPNSIDFRFWDLDNAWGKSDKIVVGWAGAGGHTFDMSLIEDAVAEVKKKWKKKVEFVSFGAEPPKTFDRHVGWVDLRKYPEKLASLGFDIGIAPLRDNLYNRGKSNLRWLEYSSLRIPTIASDVEPFRNTNALLCTTHEDWVSALNTLIDDEDIRRKLGYAAFKMVDKSFNAKTTVPALAKRLEKLLCEKRQAEAKQGPSL